MGEDEEVNTVSGIVKYKGEEIGRVKDIKTFVRRSIDGKKKELYGVITKGYLLRTPISKSIGHFPGFNAIPPEELSIEVDVGGKRKTLIVNVSFENEIPSSGELENIKFHGELQ